MNKALRAAALMLCGVAVWESLPAQAQYTGYGSKVTVPLYGASYVQADTPSGGQPPAGLDRLEQKLDAMAAQVKYLVEYVQRAEAAEKAAAPQQRDPVVSAVLQVCMKCHTAKVADESGGGLAMWNAAGEFTAYTVPALTKMIKRVNATDPGFIMPPPKAGALTADQKARFTAHARDDIAQLKAAQPK